jgi:hypothetical protein
MKRDHENLPADLDDDSATWVRSLTGPAARREDALARLHQMLLRIARRELRRRSGQLRITGPELDDLAYQAAADALLAIMAKAGQFRGESRFTTWAYKFVIFEVPAKAGRHFMNGWSALDRFLQADPRDVGCAEAMDLLHVYAELAAADASAAERYPGIAAHLRACGPCGEDFDGLLAAMHGAAG